MRACILGMEGVFTSRDIAGALPDVSMRTISTVLARMHRAGELCHNGGLHGASAWALPGVDLPAATSGAERVRAHVMGLSVPFTTRQVADALPGMSRVTVRTTLRQMRDEGLVSHNGGRGDGSRWAIVRTGQD